VLLRAFLFGFVCSFCHSVSVLYTIKSENISQAFLPSTIRVLVHYLKRAKIPRNSVFFTGKNARKNQKKTPLGGVFFWFTLKDLDYLFMLSSKRAAASRPPRPNESPRASENANTTPVKRTSTSPCAMRS